MLFPPFLLLSTLLIFLQLQETCVFILLCHSLALGLDSSHFATVSLISAMGLKSVPCQPPWHIERTNGEDECEQESTASPTGNRPAPHFYDHFPATGAVDAQPSLSVLAHLGELGTVCAQWEQLAFFVSDFVGLLWSMPPWSQDWVYLWRTVFKSVVWGMTFSSAQ